MPRRCPSVVLTMLSRRELIQRATALGLLTGFAQVIRPTSAVVTAPTSPPALQNPLSDFLQGTITGVSGNTIRVLDDSRTPWQIMMSPLATELWRAGPTTLESLRVDDFLYARGVTIAPGQLAASNVWVNIVNFWGVVRAADNAGLRFGDDSLPPVLFQKGTSLYLSGSSAPLSSTSLVGPGMGLQVLGMWDVQTR